MRARRRDCHASAGQRGRTSARWRAAAVTAAAALSLAAGTATAAAAGGYTVTATIPVGADPWGVAADPGAGTVYVTNAHEDQV
jgi:DNA-binding beta-propeller fold protein YncE